MEIITNITILFKILLLGWIIVEYPLLSVLSELVTDLLNIKNKLALYIFKKPTECFKCASFIVGLIGFFIFNYAWWLPILAAFLADYWDKNFNSIKI